jgi:hypothetical protein
MARRSIDVAPSEGVDLRALVAERAYFKAEGRGFAPGHELDDWLAAEREIADEMLVAPQPKRSKRKKIEVRGS